MNATYENLMRQAVGTVSDYLNDITLVIDGRHGEGYAAANPDFTAKLVQAVAQDFHTSIVAKIGTALSDKIERYVTLFEAANPRP
jgi:hypothetical protein